jgi:lipopolysaccharide transport system permease protein
MASNSESPFDTDQTSSGIDVALSTKPVLRGKSLEEIVYSPTPEIVQPLKLLANVFISAWEGRELAWRLFVRNLRGMYRQTLLGLAWIFLPPLANTAIWVFLRNQGLLQFELPVGVDQTVYILSGMILWQAFVESFQMPLNSINANRSMVSKLNFPREALLAEGLGEVVFNFIVRLVLLIPAMLIFEAPFYWTAALSMLMAGLLILFAAGLGMLIMPIGSLYQDVGRLMAVGLPFWMILTPIIYAPPKSYPGTMLNWLNPASPLLIAARDYLMLGSTGNQAAFHFALLAIPTFVLGLIVFRVSMPALIERMTI